MIKPIVAGIIGVAFGIGTLHRAVPVPQPVAPPPLPAPVAAVTTVAPSAMRLAAPNIEVRDGVVYVLAREPGEARTPLQVVAIDRATLATTWRSPRLSARGKRPGFWGIMEAYESEVIVEDGDRHRFAIAGGVLTPTQNEQYDVCERAETCWYQLEPIYKRLGMKREDLASDAVANGRLLRVHPGPDGEQRIVARDLRTRAKLYDVAIPGLAYGSFVYTLRAEGDEVFLVANLELYVLDARTGAVTRRFVTL